MSYVEEQGGREGVGGLSVKSSRIKYEEGGSVVWRLGIRKVGEREGWWLY